MPAGASAAERLARISTMLCGRIADSCDKAASGFCGHGSHAQHQRLDGIAGLAGRCQNRAVSVGFKVEAQQGALPADFRLQLRPAIKIEVA